MNGSTTTGGTGLKIKIKIGGQSTTLQTSAPAQAQAPAAPFASAAMPAPATTTATSAPTSASTPTTYTRDEEDGAPSSESGAAASSTSGSSGPSRALRALRSAAAAAAEVDPSVPPESYLPLTVGVLTVLSLGKVEWKKPGFHNDRYIFTPGFKARRGYYSYKDPNVRVDYTCEILDTGGDAPVFRVTPEDDPEGSVTSNTPTGAWTPIIKKCQEAKGKKNFATISGPEYFGIANFKVRRLVELLPDADKCVNYLKLDQQLALAEAAEAATAASAAAAAAGTNGTAAGPAPAKETKKRKRSSKSASVSSSSTPSALGETPSGGMVALKTPRTAVAASAAAGETEPKAPPAKRSRKSGSSSSSKSRRRPSASAAAAASAAASAASAMEDEDGADGTLRIADEDDEDTTYTPTATEKTEDSESEETDQDGAAGTGGAAAGGRMSSRDLIRLISSLPSKYPGVSKISEDDPLPPLPPSHHRNMQHFLPVYEGPEDFAEAVQYFNVPKYTPDLTGDESAQSERVAQVNVKPNHPENLLDGMWEFAYICFVINLVKQPLKIEMFEPEDLENALLNPEDNNGLLADLHIKLMKGPFIDKKALEYMDPLSWEWMNALKIKLDKSEIADYRLWEQNPLGGAQYYVKLSAACRVMIIKALCDWKLEHTERVANMVRHQSEEMLRWSEPLGTDSEGNKYIYLGPYIGRIFRESPPKLQFAEGEEDVEQLSRLPVAKAVHRGTWKMVADDITTMLQLASQMEASDSEAERELAQRIRQVVIPDCQAYNRAYGRLDHCPPEERKKLVEQRQEVREEELLERSQKRLGRGISIPDPNHKPSMNEVFQHHIDAAKLQANVETQQPRAAAAAGGPQYKFRVLSNIAPAVASVDPNRTRSGRTVRRQYTEYFDEGEEAGNGDGSTRQQPARAAAAAAAPHRPSLGIKTPSPAAMAQIQSQQQLQQQQQSAATVAKKRGRPRKDESSSSSAATPPASAVTTGAGVAPFRFQVPTSMPPVLAGLPTFPAAAAPSVGATVPAAGAGSFPFVPPVLPFVNPQLVLNMAALQQQQQQNKVATPASTGQQQQPTMTVDFNALMRVYGQQQAAANNFAPAAAPVITPPAAVTPPAPLIPGVGQPSSSSTLLGDGSSADQFDMDQFFSS